MLHDESHAIHLPYDLLAHARQASVFRFVASSGQQGLIVVGQLHEANTQGVHDLHEPDVIFDRARSLTAEEYGRPIGRYRLIDISGGTAVKDQIRMLFEVAIPALDVQHRFALETAARRALSDR